MVAVKSKRDKVTMISVKAELVSHLMMMKRSKLKNTCRCVNMTMMSSSFALKEKNRGGLLGKTSLTYVNKRSCW